MDNETHNCSGCDQKERCGRIFEKSSKTEGPNVTWPVILAFLVPILAFIVILTWANKLLRDCIEGKSLIVVTFTVALVITLVVIVIIRAFRRSRNKTL